MRREDTRDYGKVLKQWLIKRYRTLESVQADVLQALVEGVQCASHDKEVTY
jgi:hypothetical protein